MREICLNYRVKLSQGFVFKNPLCKILENDGIDLDCDIQLVDETGTIVTDYTNPNLNALNSYEGSTTVYFSDKVKNENLRHQFLYGEFDVSYQPSIVRSSKILDFNLYESVENNTFYITRCDLQEFSSNYIEEIENALQMYFSIYMLICGGVLNAEIISISLSEDRKVGKIKTRGFCHIEDFSESISSKLSRILPS